MHIVVLCVSHSLLDELWIKKTEIASFKKASHSVGIAIVLDSPLITVGYQICFLAFFACVLDLLVWYTNARRRGLCMLIDKGHRLCHVEWVQEVDPPPPN
jgi:hypothetical protein